MVLTRPLSLLIKPASADCNLRCSYCFYLPKGSLYPQANRHRMSTPVLERLLASALAAEQAVHPFTWQGGEPLLMGVRFFRTVVDLQVRHARRGAVISNAVQTNATLVTDELADLFAEYRFLVGVSVDGPASIHDSFRRGASGAGTHERVMRGIAPLRARGVALNALAAVSSANVDRPRDVYRSLCDAGILHHQYIPVVEPAADRGHAPWGIGGRQWGDFLCALFDEWLHDEGRVCVRLFDAVLAALVGDGPGLCTMETDCRHCLVVEHNGDVYPCDFYVQPDLLLGNVTTTDLSAIGDSPAFRRFGLRKAELPDECAACPSLPLCAGDCPRHRAAPGGQGTSPTRTTVLPVNMFCG